MGQMTSELRADIHLAKLGLGRVLGNIVDVEYHQIQGGYQVLV
jgi:hypothetical protein